MNKFCWFQPYRWHICFSGITLSYVSVICELDSDVCSLKTQLTTNRNTWQSYAADADVSPEFASLGVLISTWKTFCSFAYTLLTRILQLNLSFTYNTANTDNKLLSHNLCVTSDTMNLLRLPSFSAVFLYTQLPLVLFPNNPNIRFIDFIVFGIVWNKHDQWVILMLLFDVSFIKSVQIRWRLIIKCVCCYWW